MSADLIAHLRTTFAEETAAKMIHAYGWTEAHKMAVAEAAPHSPTGNLSGFWSAVLTAMEKAHTP